MVRLSCRHKVWKAEESGAMGERGATGTIKREARKQSVYIGFEGDGSEL
jgi:hypothetical protein